MSNKKDRWSALSMKERADLMNMYITNGISDLKEMKRHYNSFSDGGNTDSKREMAEIDADYFLRGWYNNPTTQAMMDQLDTRDYSKYPVVTPNGKEITDPHLARRVRVSSTLNTPVNYVEFPENKGGEFVFRNSIPKDNDININQDLWGNALMSALVHEGDHAIQYEMPFILQTTQPVKHELKAGYWPDEYLDNRKEIRSRIMSTREALNLDPNKRDYTPEEAATIQQQLIDGNHRDAAQLDRLTPETMAGYLNYLADSDAETNATPIGGVRSAKHGGRILSGNENQNNEEVLYYDDTYIEAPVVKAFNSKEDYNRYYGEKFGNQIIKERDKLGKKAGKIIYDVAQFDPKIGTLLDVIEIAKSNRGDESVLSPLMSVDGKIVNLIKSPLSSVFSKVLQFPDLAFDALNLIQDIKTPVSEYSCGGRILSGEESVDIESNQISKNALTREKYIQQQRDTARKKALQKSLDRTEPSNPLFDNIPYDIWQQDLFSDIDFHSNAILYASSEEERTMHEAALQSLKNAKYEPIVIGNNCIYTALDNYGDKYKVSGNLSFLADPAKYGFKEIDTKDIKPGDLVQHDKTHMMLFDSYDENGIPLYNYSNSRTRKAEDIKKKHPYEKHNIKDNSKYKAFTFIGLPEDVEEWNNSYNNYKKEYSNNMLEFLKKVPQLPKDKVK